MRDDELIEGHKAFAPENTKIIVREAASAASLDFSRSSYKFDRIEREITWTRESFSKLSIAHGGQELTDWGTYSDFYGFLRSADDQPAEIERAMRHYGVTESSTLEVIVSMWLEDVPTLGFSHRNHLGRDLYKRMNPKVAVYFDDDIPQDIDWDNFPHDEITLRSVGSMLHSHTKVWSSQRSKEDNDRALADFKSYADAERHVFGPPYQRGQ